MMIKRVRGTRDILDTRLFCFVVQKTIAFIQGYHFINVKTPIIEETRLFKRSLGLETDVVSKEMFFVSCEDQDGDRQKICLRPEGTASLVRAFVENGIQQIPWKVVSCGPMFRHERPQKGRFRQFYQITVEIIGAYSISHDVWLITMLDRLFNETFNLSHYALHINFLGCHQDRAPFKKILGAYLIEHESDICLTCKKRQKTNSMRIFDCKNKMCRKIYEKAPKITDHICSLCIKEWKTIQDQLDQLSVSYVHVQTLVRGLDYYSKTVFEFVSPDLGAQNSFCGGGRYNELVAKIGGKTDQPSVGAAIGIDRLIDLVSMVQDTLPISCDPAVVVIMPLSEKQSTLALILADSLRDASVCVDVLLDGSLKTMMRKANKIGASYAVLIGEEEQQAGMAVVKNMKTGDEKQVKQVDVIKYIR